jgi:hypothetical protein
MAVGRRQRLKNNLYQMQRDGALHEHRSTSEGALFKRCKSCYDLCIDRWTEVGGQDRTMLTAEYS